MLLSFRSFRLYHPLPVTRVILCYQKPRIGGIFLLTLSEQFSTSSICSAAEKHAAPIRLQDYLHYVSSLHSGMHMHAPYACTNQIV